MPFSRVRRRAAAWPWRRRARAGSQSPLEAWPHHQPLREASGFSTSWVCHACGSASAGCAASTSGRTLLGHNLLAGVLALRPGGHCCCRKRTDGRIGMRRLKGALSQRGKHHKRFLVPRNQAPFVPLLTVVLQVLKCRKKKYDAQACLTTAHLAATSFLALVDQPRSLHVPPVHLPTFPLPSARGMR